ncbi:TIGR04222 domain-containing membrane protein [Streptomyces sp. NPDC093094]|uniref:TIGR04222 domain-containing membrane protein n=1 Tax=Streptomyces sp. NPDC093094 TaxID=3366026 RepID=UPI0037F41C04
MFWVLLLLLAWAAAGLACARLCLAAVRAADRETEQDAGGDRHTSRADRDRSLTLYEAAFLSGGPRRVADLTLVSMARRRRLLLAHTGWATVVDPRGHDDIERSVIGAIGPGGQSPIAAVRTAAARADSVRALAERLAGEGLAAADDGRSSLASSVRRVRAAAALVTGLGATALLLPLPAGTPRPLMAMWFALPLALTLGSLAIARFEAHPYSRWASPAGQRLLGALARHTRDGDDRDGGHRAFLASVALRGVHAVGEPDLRAAFEHREQYPERRADRDG